MLLHTFFAVDILCASVIVCIIMISLLFFSGKYIAYSVKLPDLGQKNKRGNSGLVLGDLEEALVPYYASASKQVLFT